MQLTGKIKSSFGNVSANDQINRAERLRQNVLPAKNLTIRSPSMACGYLYCDHLLLETVIYETVFKHRLRFS